MTKPCLQADAAYENAHLVARDLLGRIGELLTDMPAPGDDQNPVNWGHVGSMSHVNELLSPVVCFLTGDEEADC